MPTHHNPYAKPRTPGHKGHSSKPTVFYGIPGERQRYWLTGPAGHTRRQRKLYPGADTPDQELKEHRKRKEKEGGTRRRGRKSRSTRRR